MVLIRLSLTAFESILGRVLPPPSLSLPYPCSPPDPAMCLLQTSTVMQTHCPRYAQTDCETPSGAASTERTTRCTAETWVTRWWRRLTLSSEYTMYLSIPLLYSYFRVQPYLLAVFQLLSRTWPEMSRIRSSYRKPPHRCPSSFSSPIGAVVILRAVILLYCWYAVSLGSTLDAVVTLGAVITRGAVIALLVGPRTYFALLLSNTMLFDSQPSLAFE